MEEKRLPEKFVEALETIGLKIIIQQDGKSCVYSGNVEMGNYVAGFGESFIDSLQDYFKAYEKRTIKTDILKPKTISGKVYIVDKKDSDIDDEVFVSLWCSTSVFLMLQELQKEWRMAN